MARERFLDELAERAGRSLPPEAAEALVAEARGHIEDSIQARLELGATPEEAEREALAAFGTAHEVAEEVWRHGPRFDRSFALSALALLAFFCWAGGSRAFPGWTWEAMIAVGVMVHGVYLFTSVRARRIQLLTILALALPVWLIATIVLATRSVTAFGLPHEISGRDIERSSVADTVARFEVAADRARRQVAALAEGYAAFESGASALEPGRTLHFEKDGVWLRRTTDRAAAESHWHNAIRFSPVVLEISVEASERARLYREAAPRPWWAELPYQAVPALRRMGVPEIVGFYGGLHILAWAYGRRLRRRRWTRWNFWRLE